MAINNVSGNSAANAAADAKSSIAGASPAPNQALGRDAFMQLLVAQLKNQDPLNPVDTENFVTQLSQLTSVEKMVEMSDQLKYLTQATDGMAANQSAGLIGKKVEAENNSVELGSTGAATSAVTLGAGADKVTVSVKNDAGRVVQTFDLEQRAAGQQKVEWDGKTSGGERAPAGAYTFSVEAKDKQGHPVAADMSVSGVVTGVSYEHGYAELIMDQTRVRLSNVKSIGQ